MREIDTNVNMSKIQNVRMEKAEATSFKGEPEQSQSADFSNPKEVLGRSQVSKTDNVQTDAEFAKQHPEIIAKADKFFDMAYTQLKDKNDPYAYEKASAMTALFVKELN